MRQNVSIIKMKVSSCVCCFSLHRLWLPVFILFLLSQIYLPHCTDIVTLLRQPVSFIC